LNIKRESYYKLMFFFFLNIYGVTAIAYSIWQIKDEYKIVSLNLQKNQIVILKTN
jgi:hypothetical protein